jgi:hypothetical protein
MEMNSIRKRETQISGLYRFLIAETAGCTLIPASASVRTPGFQSEILTKAILFLSNQYFKYESQKDDICPKAEMPVLLGRAFF